MEARLTHNQSRISCYLGDPVMADTSHQLAMKSLSRPRVNLTRVVPTTVEVYSVTLTSTASWV